MALTFGRIVHVGSDANEAAVVPQLAERGRVVSQEIADASVRVEQMLNRAEREIEQRQAAFEASLLATRAELRREAQTEADLALSAKFTELATLREREIERSRDDIVQLARLLAERVLRDTLATTPERLVELAGRYIEEARGARAVVVHAHPADAGTLEKQFETLRACTPATLRLEIDATLQPGDLRIESDVGTLNAHLGTQLQNLAAILRDSLRP